MSSKPLPANTAVRLDRFLSHATGLSRSEVRKLLRSDAVCVDGAVIRDATRQVRAEQEITLDDQVLDWPGARYLMLHKPAGYVCTTGDAHHPPVTELIAEPWAEGLHSAGRLDVDTTGLVLLTNDGQWSHRLTSPRSQCSKSYVATLRDPLTDSLAARFARGMLLEGESRPTLPAHLEPLDTHTARVELQEGRYHQVKRMFAACGNHVEALHRESVGAITLDAELEPGEWRFLSEAEVEAVFAANQGEDARD